VADLTAGQQRLRERIETVIAAAAPALDLLLAAGDRVSRIVEPEDHDPYPVRSGGEPALLEAPKESPTTTSGSSEA
jgi:hypothetical protein